MATHDYVLANASGAAFRTDLNNALAAIVSNNSNSSEPATMYAYQWWADTTNGVLKIRNSANNAWVELLQLDGTLTLEDGSASTPALAFRDDLNTGIFSSAADTFNIATAGVERMELGATTIFNESGADVDFRIEGDTEANLFYVDAGNNRIGIGTSSPQSILSAKVSASRQLDVIKDSGDDNLVLKSSAPDASYNLRTIELAGEKVAFSTGASSGTSYTERMRIDSSGRVLINTTNSANGHIAASNLAVQGADLAIFKDSEGDNSGVSGHKLKFVTQSGSLGEIDVLSEGGGGPSGRGGAMRFYTKTNNTGSATERIRIDADGRLRIGTTSQISIEAVGVVFDNNNKVGHAIKCSATGSATFMDFRNSSGTQLGNVKTTTGSNLQFNTSSSDRSLKKNFENWTENTLELFKNINPQKFNFIFEENTEAKTKGYIAQDLVDSFPEAYNKNDDDKYMFNPSGMVVYLMKAIQELEAKVATLESA